MGTTNTQAEINEVDLQGLWAELRLPFETNRIRRCLTILQQQGVLVQVESVDDLTPGETTPWWRLGTCDPADAATMRYMRPVARNTLVERYEMYQRIYAKDEETRQLRLAGQRVYALGEKFYYVDTLFPHGDYFETPEQLESLLYWVMACSNNLVLRSQAYILFGAPHQTEAGGLEFALYRGPRATENDFQVLRYAEPHWYTLLQVAQGVVVAIEGQNYRLQWPLLLKPGIPSWEYPEMEGTLTLTPTQEPVTPPLPQRRGDDCVQVWGDGFYQQEPMRSQWGTAGGPAVQFLSVPQWQGEDFSVNVALSLLEGKPARMWLEGSGT